MPPPHAAMIRRMNTCSVQVCYEHVFESPLRLEPPQLTRVNLASPSAATGRVATTSVVRQPTGALQIAPPPTRPPRDRPSGDCRPAEGLGPPNPLHRCSQDLNNHIPRPDHRPHEVRKRSSRCRYCHNRPQHLERLSWHGSWHELQPTARTVPVRPRPRREHPGCPAPQCPVP